MGDHLNFCPLAFGFAGGGNNMTKGELRAAISRGYREMSELTKVKCGGDKCPGVGNRAYRCCDRMEGARIVRVGRPARPGFADDAQCTDRRQSAIYAGDADSASMISAIKFS